MNEVRAGSGIVVPVSADTSDLKKGLEDIRRANANPQKIQIRAEMTFDDKAVAREYNKLVDGATRAAAKIKAQKMFGGETAVDPGDTRRASGGPQKGWLTGFTGAVRAAAGAYVLNEGARLAVSTARALGQMNSDDPSDVDRGRLGLLAGAEAVPLAGNVVSVAQSATGIGLGRCDDTAHVTVVDEHDACASGAYFADQIFVARTVECRDDEL